MCVLSLSFPMKKRHHPQAENRRLEPIMVMLLVGTSSIQEEADWGLGLGLFLS